MAMLLFTAFILKKKKKENPTYLQPILEKHPKKLSMSKREGFCKAVCLWENTYPLWAGESQPRSPLRSLSTQEPPDLILSNTGQRESEVKVASVVSVSLQPHGL